MPTAVRLAAHLAAAAFLAWYVLSPMHPVELLLIVLAIGWITNLYNFMDGSDGLDQIFPARTTADWMERLTAIDVLAAPVASYQEILQSEQAAVNGYVAEMDHPELGRIRVVGSPIGLSETPVTVSAPPPELGQNTEEVLLDAGFDWAEIEALRGNGAT